MNHEIVDQVKDWMQSHSNHSLLISKEEDGDLDQVELKVSHISIGTLEAPDPDNYVAPQSLLFHGKGTIISGENQSPLPLDVYEIPVYGTWISQNKEEQFQIRTDRGVYTIQTQ